MIDEIRVAAAQALEQVVALSREAHDRGAMKAMLVRNPKLQAPNLDKWLYHANNAAFRLQHEGARSMTH